MDLLEVRHATKLYSLEGDPVAALRDVSLTVDAGEFVALVGRSGCGKSTLLNLCGAMDFPTSGDILIDGEPTSGLSDSQLTRVRREKVGFIFQSFQLMHTLTAVENVELPLMLARKANPRATAATSRSGCSRATPVPSSGSGSRPTASSFPSAAGIG